MRTELARAEVLRLQRIESFRHDPLGFVEWAFPWGEAEGPLAHHAGPEAWQEKVLRAVGDGLASRAAESGGPVRVAVASGHGVGKSALVAWLILWAMATDPMDPATGLVATARPGRLTALPSELMAEIRSVPAV